jgi:chromosome segregation ATPase
MSQHSTKTQKEPIQPKIFTEVRSIGVKVQKLEKKVDKLAGSMSLLNGEVQNVKTDLDHVKTDLGHVKVDLGHVKTDLSHVKTVVGNLKLDMQEVKLRLDSHDEKFNALFIMMDNMAKKLQDMHDEQRAGFSNYSRLDKIVEHHDKEIVVIKQHLSLA